MSGLAQFIFVLLMIGGILFIWSAAGFIYAIIKYAKNPPPEPLSNIEPECMTCAYLCAFASSISFNEQIIFFPNLVIAYIACKIINCDCE